MKQEQIRAKLLRSSEEATVGMVRLLNTTGVHMSTPTYTGTEATL